MSGNPLSRRGAHKAATLARYRHFDHPSIVPFCSTPKPHWFSLVGGKENQCENPSNLLEVPMVVTPRRRFAISHFGNPRFSNARIRSLPVTDIFLLENSADPVSLAFARSNLANVPRTFSLHGELPFPDPLPFDSPWCIQKASIKLAI